MSRWLHIEVDRAVVFLSPRIDMIVSRDQKPSSGNTSVYTSEQSVYTTRAVPDARKCPLETCDTTVSLLDWNHVIYWLGTHAAS